MSKSHTTALLEQLSPAEQSGLLSLTVTHDPPPSGMVAQLLHALQPHKTYTLDDKGFSRLFANIYRDQCRFNVTAGEWFTYTGKVWQEDTGGMIVAELAKDFSDELVRYSLSIEDETSKAAFLKYVARLGQYRHRKTLVEDAKSLYPISHTDLDQNGDLFNCLNGTYNLKTMSFSPHNPTDLLSKVSNVKYDPTANPATWADFVHEVTQGNPEKVIYLQKILGYALTADTSLETCFILYGATTRNGKSTLVETIAYMLGNTGGYALNTQPQTLAQKQNKDTRGASGDIARLEGCRFLNASEPPKRMVFDVALLKTLLGRDSISARQLYEREHEFTPCFKLFINTNFLPSIPDDTLFSSGRINVITFDRHFATEEQDQTLKERLRDPDSVSGIFNWCLQGLTMFRLEGATPPACVVDSNAEYRANSDKLGNFLAECMEKTGKNSKGGDVYRSYQGWCETNGFGCESRTNFFDELRGKGLLAKKATVSGASFFNVVTGYEPIKDDYMEMPHNISPFSA